MYLKTVANEFQSSTPKGVEPHFPATICAIARSAKLVAGRLCQAFTLIRGDGTVVCWGNKVACGQFLGVPFLVGGAWGV